MSWNHVYGHERQRDRLQKSIASQRLPGTLLFVGPEGIGKRRFAMEFAKALLCRNSDDQNLDACDHCLDCTQFDAGSHPDLILVSKQKDRNQLLIEQFVGDDDHRMREGMCHDIGLKPFRGKRKVAIIDDADLFSPESANCLLKTLEEPPPGSVIILIGTGEQRQLSTIRSRSQIIRFQPLSDTQVERILIDQNLIEDQQTAKLSAGLAHGSVQQALTMADNELREFRDNWIQQLSTLDPARNEFSKTLLAIIDDAGTDNAKKRHRFAWAIDCAIEFYRSLLAQMDAIQVDCDSVLESALQYARKNAHLSYEYVCDCIDVCFDTQRQITANAHIATLVPHFLGRLIVRVAV